MNKPELIRIYIRRIHSIPHQISAGDSFELRADFDNDRHYAKRLKHLDADHVADALHHLAALIARDPTLKQK